MSPRLPQNPARRTVLRGSLAASAALAVPSIAAAAPAFALSGRPRADWGVQAGDVTAHSGLVWARSDRPARMIVETSATDSFHRTTRRLGPLLGPDSDFTGTTALHGLPRASRSTTGRCSPTRTTRAAPASPWPARHRLGTPAGRVRFLWSGDLAGQGWGINP